MANYNYVGVACNFMLRKNYVLNYNPWLQKNLSMCMVNFQEQFVIKASTNHGYKKILLLCVVNFQEHFSTKSGL